MMFERFRRFFNKEEDELLPELLREPEPSKPLFGDLSIPSRTLALCSHMEPFGFQEISGFESETVRIESIYSVDEYGQEWLTGLEISMGSEPVKRERTTTEPLNVSGIKLVIADRDDLKQHWTETGSDRIGVINTARDHRLRRLLEKKFKLKTRQVNNVRAEVLGNVSEELEQKILDYLETRPDCRDFPFMYFHVHTNNSFEKVNFMRSCWEFFPIGNESTPEMFACYAIEGEGARLVHKHYSRERLVGLTIDFKGPCEED